MNSISSYDNFSWEYINNEYKNLDNKKKKFKIISKFNLKIKKKNLELFLNLI